MRKRGKKITACVAAAAWLALGRTGHAGHADVAPPSPSPDMPPAFGSPTPPPPPASDRPRAFGPPSPSPDTPPAFGSPAPPPAQPTAPPAPGDGQGPGQGPAAGQGPAPPSPGPPRLVGPVVQLLPDNPHATLQTETRLDWRDVCVAPCGAVLDPSRNYRVGGRPFVPSEPFTLPRRSGQVTIEAHMGSRTRSIVGEALALGGLGAAATGTFLYLEGSNQPNDAFGESPARLLLHAYGVVALVAGIALVLTGLPLWASSSTSIDVQ